MTVIRKQRVLYILGAIDRFGFHCKFGSCTIDGVLLGAAT